VPDASRESSPGSDAPGALLDDPRPAAAQAGLTLDAAVTALWNQLTRAEPAACPVCDAPMAPRHSAAGVVGGRCRSCGSTLA
jgi:hypothetical protein